MTAGLRDRVLRHVERSTQLTLRVQSHRTPWRDKAMRFATLLGDIEFYIVLLPVIRWIAVPFGLVPLDFAYRFTALLLTSALLAGVIKDVANLPRPPHDRVWTHKIELDRGFVSSHSMNAAALAFFTLASLWSRLGTPAQLVGTAVALAWSGAVAFSRLYNGAHSYPDIIAGYSLGISFGLLVASDAFAQWSVGWPPAMLSVAVAIVHPRPPTVTASRAVSLACLLVGLALAYQLDQFDWSASSGVLMLARIPRPDLALLWERCSVAGPVIVRLVVGLTAFRLYYVLMKLLAKSIAPRISLRAVDALAQSFAIPTYRYDKLSEKDKRALDAVIADTQHRAPLSLLIMLGVFWLLPLMLSALAIANVPAECQR
jgi:membrane-associated phospholipid phosphatase